MNGTKHGEDGDFAPVDLSDRRGRYEWSTRWPPEARRSIGVEAIYLAVLITGVPIAILFVWKGSLQSLLDLSSAQHKTFVHYAIAWLAGVLGGASFAMKWLYHAVAKGEWHLDRRLWRLAVPPLSGGLALATSAFVAADILTILNSSQLSRPAAVLAFAFLVGYFSDNVIASLLRLAERLFGEPRSVYPPRNESRTAPRPTRDASPGPSDHPDDE